MKLGVVMLLTYLYFMLLTTITPKAMRNATPKFEIPVKKSNNYEFYKRAELSRVLTFIEYAQKKRIKGGCTAMPIPTTSRKNLMIWGYPKAISRGIEFMKEIGLITVHIDQFRFGVPFEGANYGKTYFPYITLPILNYINNNRAQNVDVYII